MEAAERDDAVGHTYQLGGADEVSFVQLAHQVLNASGAPGEPLPLPPPVAKGLAVGLERLLPKAPLTMEGVRAVVAGTPIDLGPARRDLGFEPRPLEEALGA